MLNACDSVFHLALFWLSRFYLREICIFLVNVYLRVYLHKLHSTHLSSQSTGISLYNLSKVSNTVFNRRFNLMEFIPQVFLNNTHILPSIHSIGFYISNYFLIVSLLMFITFNIYLQISFFRTLDDNLGHFLRCFYFVYSYFVLKTHSYDIRQWHIVNLLRGFHLCIWDQALSRLVLSL